MPASTSQSSESAASPRVPISPFSFTSSSESHYTSDDLPDLGAFNTVLREWVYLQPQPRIPPYHSEPTRFTNTTTIDVSDDTGNTGRRSTVWNHQPIAEYLHVSETESTASNADLDEDTDTEGARSVEIETVIDEDSGDQDTRLGLSSPSSTPFKSFTPSPLQTQPSFEDSSAQYLELEELDIDVDFQPSLGYLDEALSFIASERARLDAQRVAGGSTTTTASAWKHVIEPRRKRRRKRPGKGVTMRASSVPRSSLFNTLGDEERVNYDDDEDDEDEDDNASLLPMPLKAKSTPVTPTVRRLRAGFTDPYSYTSPTTDSDVKPSKKSLKPKSVAKHPVKILTHSRSTPGLRAQTSATTTVNTEIRADTVVPTHEGTNASGEAHKLLALSNELADLFPADREALAGVEAKLRVVENNYKESDGAELDPRGREPVGGDTLIHVFIDHSNILIGLLMYLKRHPTLLSSTGGTNNKVQESTSGPKLRRSKLPSPTDSFEAKGKSGKGKLSRPLPQISSTQLTSTVTPPSASISPTLPQTQEQATAGTPIPLPSFATAARLLNIDTHISTPPVVESTAPSPLSVSMSPTAVSPNSNPKWKSKSKSTPVLVPNNNLRSSAAISIPIPLSTPMSDDVSLLGNNIVGHQGISNNKRRGRGNGSQDRDVQSEDDGGGEKPLGKQQKKKHQARHLSHTALTLILERGRPITRRVLVTSSPLYQPMDTMERLGYEVRVYLRVPDLGDGMDRKSHRRTGSGSSATNTSIKRNKGHVRHVSGNTSTEGTAGSTGAGEIGKGLARSLIAPSFTFPSYSLLTPTSAENIPVSASAPATSTLTSTGSLQHLYSNHLHHRKHQPYPQLHGQTQGTSAARIRYREQGVDELLQLKLHQALAATDDVPDGATIVLATGDGNVGQFNEDGFLGPVRTALRRGWRVELYAWEEGLSRAWRKEFGEGSEWERRGMFRIIGLEQFAASLVKGGP